MNTTTTPRSTPASGRYKKITITRADARDADYHNPFGCLLAHALARLGVEHATVYHRRVLLDHGRRRPPVHYTFSHDDECNLRDAHLNKTLLPLTIELKRVPEAVAAKAERLEGML